VLGRLVAEQWRRALTSTLGADAAAAARVVGETSTDQSHPDLRALGIHPQVAGTDPDRKYPHVLFCAPAGARAEEYAKSCAAAGARWDGTGNFVFTSSAGVYAEDDGGVVDEASPVQRGNPRVDRILDAEAACLAAGGSVVRLAGLYTADRGPHPFWLRSQQPVQGRADGLINMIAYEDAAAACVTLLRTPAVRRETFLVGDGTPMTREEICQSARRLKRYAAFPVPTFVSTGKGTLGKRYDCRKVQSVLGWAPRYPSFDAFMADLAQRD